MICLGVETSCDETALALVKDGGLVAQSLVSQDMIHAIYGGVVPEIASREHLRMLYPLQEELMRKAGIGYSELDAVAVSRGPGLLGALLVGMAFAKGLCLGLNARLIGVNHLHAHLLAPGLRQELEFPLLGLLVSGGHTNIYLIESAVSFKELGRTLDDAAGEALDKSAKMLNLPYPGGKHLDWLARGCEPKRDLLPRPYIDNDNLNFSFSGLKTAVSLLLAGKPHLRFQRMPEPGQELADLATSEHGVFCASLLYAVCETLRIKLERALRRHPEVKGLVVAGGVAANSMLRKTMSGLAAEYGIRAYLPEIDLCTDNAAMIAYAGYHLAKAGLRHGLEVDAVPRGRAVPWDYLAD